LANSAFDPIWSKINILKNHSTSKKELAKYFNLLELHPDGATFGCAQQHLQKIGGSVVK